MNSEQRSVLLGMVSAALLALVLFAVTAIAAERWSATNPSVEFRLQILATSLMAPALTLFLCIARLAKHRFFTPEDINGSALTDGTSKARLLQSLLQNTLEQALLTLFVYLACSAFLPSKLLCLIPLSALMFLVGRIAFFAGYSGGAPKRAFGFALTFYPTVILGFVASYHLLTHFTA